MGVLRLAVSRFALDSQTVGERVVSELDFSALSGAFLFILELASWGEGRLSHGDSEEKVKKLHVYCFRLILLERSFVTFMEESCLAR